MRLIDSCITQLKAQGPSRTCNESKATLETTLGQMAPPKSGHPLRMPPESGGIPGRTSQMWTPFALMLSPGWRESTRRRSAPGGAAVLRGSGATQGQIDGFFSQITYKCHQNRVAAVGVDLRFAPGLPPGWFGVGFQNWFVVPRVKGDQSSGCREQNNFATVATSIQSLHPRNAPAPQPRSKPAPGTPFVFD